MRWSSTDHCPATYGPCETAGELGFDWGGGGTLACMDPGLTAETTDWPRAFDAGSSPIAQPLRAEFAVDAGAGDPGDCFAVDLGIGGQVRLDLDP